MWSVLRAFMATLGFVMFVGIFVDIWWWSWLEYVLMAICSMLLFVNTVVPRWMMLLVCKISNKHRRVELISWGGRQNVTVASRRDNHTWLCTRSWSGAGNEYILLPNGLLQSKPGSVNMHFWLPLDPQERMAMALTWDLEPLFHALAMEDEMRRGFELFNVRRTMLVQYKAYKDNGSHD